MLKTPKTTQDAATDFPNGAALSAPVNDYDPLNSPTFSADDRLAKILTVLRSKKQKILDAADKYSIHPSAIAIAIAWEFVENVRGFVSDMLLPISVQRDYGFGQFSRETLKRSQPRLSNSDVDNVRRNADAAIEAIAKHTGEQRDIYKRESGGIDLSNWPEGLAWLFNTNTDYIKYNAAPKHLEDAKSGKAVNLVLENNMAYWGQEHRAEFSWLTPKQALPISAVPYSKSVRATYDVARSEDDRYDPGVLFRSK